MSNKARAPSPVSSDSGSSTAAAAEQEEERQVKRRKVTFEENDALGQAAVAAFAPPKGLKKVVADETLDDFDYEKLKQKLANGCELWAIRIPEGLKLRHLGDVQLAKPSSSDSTQVLGKFTAKKSDYEVLSLGSDASSVGAGELQGLTPLLGSRSTKKYSAAPAPIARHLVIRRDFAIPPEASNTNLQQEDDAEQMQSTHIQPEDLKGFFAPAGYHTQPKSTALASAASPKKRKSKHDDKSANAEAASGDASAMAVDTNPAKDASQSEKKEKRKKRKSETK